MPGFASVSMTCLSCLWLPAEECGVHLDTRKGQSSPGARFNLAKLQGRQTNFVHFRLVRNSCL